MTEGGVTLWVTITYCDARPGQIAEIFDLAKMSFSEGIYYSKSTKKDVIKNFKINSFYNVFFIQ
ncbi:hypothetical protein QE390_004710 [Siphonobacter sp. SORGH_AS 1065]|nr:hypothetical protein [Siphonobacter sp. SORGH_AS_1065]